MKKIYGTEGRTFYMNLLDEEIENIMRHLDPKKEEPMKIYCIDCKYLKSSITYYCSHPDNIIDTWLKKDSDYKYLPCIRNEHNNCDWFEGKEI